jgi:uncharacterized membrane protein
MTNRVSIGQILEQLENEGFVLDEASETEQALAMNDSNPWFIQGLMGCGGWLAAFFLLGFSTFCISSLFVGLSESTFGWILFVWGAIFAGATTVFHRKSDKGMFQSQLLLAIHIAGHLMLIAGIFVGLELWNYNAVASILAIIIIIVELIFFFIYPDAIFRFIATLAIVSALNLLIYDLAIIGSLSVLAAGLALLGVVIWGDLLNPKQQIDHFSLLQAIGYGIVLGMFGTIIHELSIRYGFAEYTRTQLYQPLVTSFLLLIWLLWIEIRLLQDYRVLPRSNFALAILAITALVALPTMTTPGILAGILVILLAFRRRNWVLLGLAYLFFAGFIMEYYYSLEVTLLIKSIIMMLTGTLLILGRLFMRRIVTIPDASEGGAA